VLRGLVVIGIAERAGCDIFTAIPHKYRKCPFRSFSFVALTDAPAQRRPTRSSQDDLVRNYLIRCDPARNKLR
jgi:hypothetical protein